MRLAHGNVILHFVSEMSTFSKGDGLVNSMVWLSAKPYLSDRSLKVKGNMGMFERGFRKGASHREDGEGARGGGFLAAAYLAAQECLCHFLSYYVFPLFLQEQSLIGN